MRSSQLEKALNLLGALLADRGHQVDVVAIGGAGLLLLRIIDRPTKDIDVIALVEADELVAVGNALPAFLAEAVEDVARSLNLKSNWVNTGPRTLMDLGLPAGFKNRLERRRYGGLQLFLASRWDQIHFKLYAAADGEPGGKHHMDLRRLRPTHEELRAAAGWAKTHDPSDGFATMLTGVLRDFGIED